MKRSKLHTEFTADEVRRAASGSVAVRGHRYRISLPRAAGKKTANYYYDFSAHPLRDLIPHYLLGSLDELTAGALNQRCRAVLLLGEFLTSARTDDLRPETFKSLCHWMLGAKNTNGTRRYSDAAIPTYVNYVKAFYKSGLDQGFPGWTQDDLDLMTATSIKILRGCKERAVQGSVEKALSFDTYSMLLRAVTYEFDECRRVLEATRAGRRKSLYNLEARFMAIVDPNPFVVLALLAALQHGLRAEELNALTATDLRTDGEGKHYEVYVHAPNKADDFVPVSEAFVAAWRLCEEWGEEARSVVGPPGGELFQGSLLIYPPVNSNHSEALMQLDSYYLNYSHLPYFFKKWFGRQSKDERGAVHPILHAEGDPTHPLKVSYRKLRNAFAVRLAEREKNRAVTSRALRHKQVSTSERFYLQQTRLEHARKVQIALKSEAYLVAIGLRNPTAAGITEETLRRAGESGAVTPHGLCGSALEGGGCERSSDCLTCPFLVALESRRPRFVADRDTYLSDAERLEREGDYRGAENALSRAKLCQAYLIRMEETFDRRA